MKIVGEKRTLGSHAVRLLAESDADEKVLKDFFSSVRANPVMRAVMERSAAEDWNSLLLEEFS